jgi:pimeloyl-ACP methyl ester carboxylesterase
MADAASTSSISNQPGFLIQGHSHFVACESNKVHYRTLGQGAATLVFIHGWACHLGFWREQATAFAGQARLIFIDLPGHGQSDKPQTAYTMDFLARAVVAVLRDAQVEKAVLIGHSLGAAVMCRVYQQAPAQVAALVSVDGLLCRPPGTPELAMQFIGQFRVPEYLTHARNFFSQFFPYPGTEQLRDQVIAEMLATPQHVIAGEAEGMVGLDQPDWALPKADVPVLVLNAPNPMWSERFQQYVRSLSTQVDYRLFEGTGHFLMLEKPAEFNASLTEMLRKFDLLAK